MKDQDERHANDLSRYIFPGASGMIGICMTLIGLIKLLENGSESRLADECIAVIVTIFFFSSLLSYAAIRIAHRIETSRRLERIADVLFAGGLVGIVLIGFLFAFDQL